VKLRSPLRRQTLWVGFVAVLLPLAVLLVLQYRWLRQLDSTSGIVHRATLVNFLEGVANEVEYSYRNDAERMLNLPPSIFTHDHLDKAAIWFKKKGVEGASRLFVVSFANTADGDVLFFQPSCSSFEPPSWSPEAKRFHRGVVLDDVEAQPGLGDLVPVERKRGEVPGALARMLTPIGVEPWQDSNRALDPDLAERLPEWVRRLFEKDVRELDHGRPVACLRWYGTRLVSGARAGVTRTAWYHGTP